VPTLAEALGVAAFGPAKSAKPRGCEVVAFTGSGGKTTAMLRLAAELVARGARVLITTTTHIYPPDSQQFPVTVVEASLEAAVERARRAFDRHPAVVLASKFGADGKLVGVDAGWIEQLSKQLDLTHVLVEADGSRGRPFKAPAAHEPVIPPSADLVVAVVGLSAVGQALSEEFVHRPERVAELVGCRLGDTLSPALVATVLLHPQGSTRGTPVRARVVALLNQADDESRMRVGCEVARELIERGAERVVIAALREPAPIRKVITGESLGPIRAVKNASAGDAVDRPASGVATVSAIVLAAGEGRRMGLTPPQAKSRLARDPALKLALRLGGKSILRHVVEAALASSVDEVIVVLGHGAAELERELPRDSRVRAVYNPDYATGQSSSLKVGINAITSPHDAQLWRAGGSQISSRRDAQLAVPGVSTSGAQAAIFLLGDQPLISPQAIEALLNAFRRRQSALVRASYRGTPGHPVLFSRALFLELLQVTGDQGGRELLARHEAEVVTVELNLDSPIDIDTKNDYSELVRKFPDLEKL
jgi:molybdenum cofactor cytidylyltransferase